MARHILLTGAPGCGKTTVVRRVVDRLREARVPLFGFWTEDMRESGRRVGFAIETVDGARGVLAHQDFGSGPRVSRYGVDVEGFERLAVAEIERAVEAALQGHPEGGLSGSPEWAGDGVLVVDEIGKMELFSDAFRRAILAAFDSRLRILATIMQRPNPFADRMKARPDAALTVVTVANRDALADKTVAALTASPKGP